MKTCEEYVLKRVEELEKEVDALKADKEKLLTDLDAVKNNVKFIIDFGKELKIEDRDEDYNKVFYKEGYVTLYRKNDKNDGIGVFFEKIKELSEELNG